jgi:lipopolysaccharide transport protein LptA
MEPPTRRRFRRSNVAWLRRLLLVALVLAVAALVGLFLFGRAGKTRRPRREEPVDAAAEQGMALVGEDFDYTFTERERPLFRIRGKSIRVDRDETIYLDGVALTLYDRRGREYHVESREASFNRASNEGRLRGDVYLKGPEGLELRTAQLQLRDKGALLITPRPPVDVNYGDQYLAHAKKLEIHLPENLYLMDGNPWLESLPGAKVPVSLKADQFVYERESRTLRLEGGAVLRRGEETVKAVRVTAFLSQDEKSLMFVRALWDVSGQGAAAGEGGKGKATTVRFAGKDLAVLLQPGNNEVQKLTLDGAPRAPSRIEASGGGLTRTLVANHVEGVLGEGRRLTSAAAFGDVEIREATHGPGGKPLLRQAHGTRAQAAFRPDGQMSTVDLLGGVTYQDGDVKATGDRVAMNFDAGHGEFTGTPVEVVSDRGRLRGPRVVYNTADKVAQVQGGVHATIERVSETALAGSPLGTGEGPVLVEAKEGVWRQTPSSFLFRGDVRAWRGENLLLAPELRGDKQEDRLTATGGVKTLWIPAVAVAAAGTRAAAGSGGKRSPVQVVASDLLYRNGPGVLTYTGNVQVDQEGKTLNCQQLVMELSKDRKPQTMTCSGGAHLKDPQAGRSIDGQTAVYHLERRVVDMTGDKVVLHDRDGNQVQGRHLVYHLDDSKVEVKGAEAAAGSPATAVPKPEGRR